MSSIAGKGYYELHNEAYIMAVDMVVTASTRKRRASGDIDLEDPESDQVQQVEN